jgi:hypothetical protein
MWVWIHHQFNMAMLFLAIGSFGLMHFAAKNPRQAGTLGKIAWGFFRKR